MELLFDADKASEFINKVIPVEKLQEVIAKANAGEKKPELTAVN